MLNRREMLKSTISLSALSFLPNLEWISSKHEEFDWLYKLVNSLNADSDLEWCKTPFGHKFGQDYYWALAINENMVVGQKNPNAINLPVIPKDKVSRTVEILNF